MWQVVAALIQLVILFTKNKFEKDAEERKRKDALYVEAKKAVAARDASGITRIFDSLRN